MTAAQSRALCELMPQFGIPAKTKLLDMPELFGRDAARWIEIGFGNGDNLLALARQQPDMDFLGIEVHRPGVGRLLNALSTEGLTNIRVACDDAFDFLRDRVPNTSVNRAQLLFSDPWPKKRHHKRRIVQPQFVSHIARILVSGGIFQLATDWAPYAEHILAVLDVDENFTNLSKTNTFIPRPAERPQTRFEKRGGKLGHDVYDLMFKRN